MPEGEKILHDGYLLLLFIQQIVMDGASARSNIAPGHEDTARKEMNTDLVFLQASGEIDIQTHIHRYP